MRRSAGALTILALAGGVPLGAQQPTDSAPGVRGGPAAARVLVRSKDFTLILGGAFKTTFLNAAARGVPVATPFLLFPQIGDGTDEYVSNLDARASNIILAVVGPRVGLFTVGGRFVLTMTGANVLSGSYGVTPLEALGDLANDDWRFAFGLQTDVFSPRIPKNVDMIWALAATGNPGNFTRTQLRAERSLQLGPRDRLTLTVAVSQAFPTTISTNVNPGLGFPQFRISEATGLPALEGSVAWKHGDVPGDALLAWPAAQAGISGVTGQYRTLQADTAVTSVKTRFAGVAVDGAVRLGRRLGVQGELFWGQGLGNYAGQVLQTTNAAGVPIRGVGGWAAVAYAWNATWQSHAGYGVDDPDDGDDPAILRNEAAFLNVFWDVAPHLQLSAELTWRATDWNGLPDNDGAQLMLASQLSF